MKKYFCVFCAVLFLLVGGLWPVMAQDRTGYGPGLVTKNASEKEIVDKIGQILPKTWTLGYIKRNVAPASWKGSMDTLEFGMTDSTTLYDEVKQINYNPTLILWFCPKDWTGGKKQVPEKAKDFIAAYLGENEKNRVYYLNLGKTTWLTYIDDLKKTFSLKQVNK